MTAAGGPALRIVGLEKAFGPTRALRGVDVEVAGGTVHALLGGNGSGKSTLVKILAGVHHADGGTIELGGTSFPARAYRAGDGHRHGLRFVHQELGLIETATIAENMAFARGWPTGAGGRVAWRSLNAATAALLARYEIDASPRTPVGMLRPADRTMVAVARALGDDDSADGDPAAGDSADGDPADGDATEADPADGGSRRILVLDEPTASLARHESELLLRAVRRRADLGQTVVLITHHLAEVLAGADVLTVLRDGRTAGTLPAAEADEEAVVSLMAGRAVAALGRRQDAPEPAATGPAGPALRVRGLTAGPLVDVDVDVQAGEIVGVTGLLGSGRSSLLRAVFGDLPHARGTVEIDGVPLPAGSPSRAMSAGVALVPEDRAADAAFPDRTVSENLSAAVIGRYWRGGRMALGRERRDTRDLITRFGIRADGPAALLSTLSGGNQQKSVLARWLRRTPKVLLLDEPTQGVDVVSRADIYRLVRAAAADGCAVLVASSDNEELGLLCDRALVLAAGRIVARVGPDQLDDDTLVRLTQTTARPPAAAAAAGGTS